MLPTRNLLCGAVAVFCAIASFFPNSVQSQIQFDQVNPSPPIFEEVQNSSIAFADVDGDEDVLITGLGAGLVSSLYDNTTIVVEPLEASFVLTPSATTVASCDEFTVLVSIETNTEFNLAEARLTFPPSLLEVVSINAPGGGSLPTAPLIFTAGGSSFDNVNGTLSYNASVPGQLGIPSPGLDFFEVTFKALGDAGTASIIPVLSPSYPRSVIAISGFQDGIAVNVDLLNGFEQIDVNLIPSTSAETYASTLSLPISIGSGISNEQMAISQNCEIEIGLKAKRRFLGDIIPVGSPQNIYQVGTGLSPNSSANTATDPGLPRWDYLLSVDLGDDTFNDLDVKLEVDFDPADPSGTAPYIADISSLMIGLGQGNTSIVQESQSLGFDFWQTLMEPGILPFDPYAPGKYDLKLTVASGNDILAEISIVVEVDCQFVIPADDIDPPVLTCSGDLTANTDLVSCLATLSGTAPGILTDNCTTNLSYNITGATTASSTGNVDGVPFALGVSTVTYTADDGNGNNATPCSFTVTVEDNIAPTAICQAVTVQLDASGDGTLVASALNGGSSDNCIPLSLSFGVLGCPDGLTYNQNASPEVIFGDGNGNGFFTLGNGSNVELGLRAKVRYPSPSETYNSNNDGSYNHLAGAFGSGGIQSGWNFEWSINTDQDGTSGQNLDALTYELGLDFDPTDGVQFLVQDPINLPFADHAIGDNSTTNGDGASAVDDLDYAALIAGNNVAQNSWRHNFFGAFDGNVDGRYEVYLKAFDSNGDVVAQTAITVIVGAGTGNAYAGCLMPLDSKDYDCSNTGTNTETLVVIDGSGNSSTCTAIVTVEDNVDPVALCKDATVNFDASGIATVVPGDIDNGSNDACGILSLTLNNTTFDCTDFISASGSPLRITGVFDGPLTGGTPKGIELYVAEDITDLSEYGVGSANNGGGTDGEEITLSGSATAGSYIYISSESTQFNSFFGFDTDYTSGAAGINGDDAIELFHNGVVIDVFGDINTDGSGEDWDYLDGWAYRIDATEPNGGIFNIADWTFSGPNALDGESTNGTAATPFPVGAYTAGSSGGASEAVVIMTVFDNNGNSSTCTSTVTLVDNIPPMAVCQDITVQLDATGNASITAGQIDNGSSDVCGSVSLSISPSSFDCSHVGTTNVTLTVEDDNGNISTCTAIVTVEDNVAPDASCQDITVQLDATGDASILVADVHGSSTDACGISDACFLTQSIQQVVTGTLDFGETTFEYFNDDRPEEACFEVPSFGCCGLNTGIHPYATDIVTITQEGVYTFTLADINENVDFAGAIYSAPLNSNDICENLIANDDDSAGNADPEIVISVTLVPGTYYLTTLTYSASDDFPAPYSWNIALGGCVPELFYTCNDAGSNTVELLVTDIHGNSSTCTANITVEDNIDPIAICEDITVQLDGNGSASILADDIDNGSNDVCGIGSLSVNPASFNCSDVGANTVTLTVTDNNGNTSTCDATVTVEDIIFPTASCQDLTVQLDANGDGTLVASALDNGSSDNCGSPSLGVLGCPAGLTYNQNTTSEVIFGDGNGNGFFTLGNGSNVELGLRAKVRYPSPSETYNSNGDGSYSHLAGAFGGDGMQSGWNFEWSINTDQDGTSGQNLDALTYELGLDFDPTDGVQFLVQDPINLPFADHAIGDNTTTNGDGASAVDDLDYAALIAGNNVAQNSWRHNFFGAFNGNLDGRYEVYLKAFDSNGVLVAQTAISVIVGAGTGNAYAGCLMPLDSIYYDCADIGVFAETLVVIDASGNSSSCTANVTIEDNEAPEAICASGIQVVLDASGQGTLTAQDVDNGSNDACGIASISIDKTDFTCSDISAQAPDPTFDLIISGIVDGDLSGGLPKGIELYVVHDIADLSIYGLGLSTNGSGSNGQDYALTGSATAGSYLYIASESNQFNTFFGFTPNFTNSVANVNGDDVVELFENGTVIDVFGELGTDGTGEDWEYKDGWAYRNIATEPNGGTFNSADWTFSGVGALEDETTNASATTPFPIGTYTTGGSSGTNVTLTVTDVNGNVSTCMASVEVIDNVLPSAICQDVTVQLDGTGNASITAAQIDNGSNDACGIASLDLSQTGFTCSDVGANTVTLTVTDNNGNTSTCDATVTVEDNVAPTASCQDVTVQLDANGDGTLVASALNDGSSDNCGSPSLGVLGCPAGLTYNQNASPEVIFGDGNGNGFFTLGNGSNVELGLRAKVRYPSPSETYNSNGDGSYNHLAGAFGGDGMQSGWNFEWSINTDQDGTSGQNLDALTYELGLDFDPTDGVQFLVQDPINLPFADHAIGDNSTTNGDGASAVDDLDYAALIAGNNVAQNSWRHNFFGAFNGNLDGRYEVYLKAFDSNGVLVAQTAISVIVGAGTGNAYAGCLMPLASKDYDCSNTGVNTETLVVIDASGNSSTCTANVTVVDGTPPSFTCATDATVFINQLNNTYQVQGVQYDPSNVADNCSDPVVITHNAATVLGVGPAGTNDNSLAGWELPVGVHTIEFTATDDSGNSTSCPVEITVEATSVSGNATINLDCTPLDMRVRIYGDGTQTQVGNDYFVQIDANGDYDLVLSGVPPGIYDVYFKVDTYLQQGYDLDLSNGTASKNLSSIIPGDIAIDLAEGVYGDNQVNGTDLSLLVNAYNTLLGNPLYSPRADLDCNGQVDGLDMSLLIFFYNQPGDTPQN